MGVAPPFKGHLEFLGSTFWLSYDQWGGAAMQGQSLATENCTVSCMALDVHVDETLTDD